MPLTSRLDHPSVKPLLKAWVKNPGLRPRPAVLVQPRGYAPLVGTAFDYAMRFGLAARHPAHARDALVADTALPVALMHPALHPHRAAIRSLHERAYALLDGADFSEDQLSETAARATLLLGLLDTLRRARPQFAEKTLSRTPTSADLADVQALFAVVPWARFTPAARLALNPTFNEGSAEVGGADADLVLDDTLIEIKAVKEQSLQKDHVHQVVAYALLARRFGLSGEEGPAPLTSGGVYFARAAHLHTFPLAACIAPEHEAPLLDALIAAE
ncbi:MAG: hypothetical protein H6741_21700 [Alphaproteobacteria bacterium]|nr:hypothetical protein [Alphaproteobacteria bacterium]